MAAPWRFLPVGDASCECEEAGCDCLKVVIAGLGNDECDECEDINGTWYVARVGETDVWRGYLCVGEDNDAKCDLTRLKVEIVGSGSAGWALRATAYNLAETKSLVWEKDCGEAKPDCTSWSTAQTLDFDGATDVSCEGSGSVPSTATISLHSGACTTGHPCGACPCAYCEDGISPYCVKATLSGVATNTCGCDCTPLNDTYDLARTDTCEWSGSACKEEHPWKICGSGAFTLSVSQDGADYVVELTLATDDGLVTWKKTSAEKPNCLEWENESLSYVSQTGTVKCDFSNSSITLTSEQLTGDECEDTDSTCETFGCNPSTCPWCVPCAEDTPPKIQVTIPAFDNVDCEDCADLAGVYILDWLAEASWYPASQICYPSAGGKKQCYWRYIFPEGAPCGPAYLLLGYFWTGTYYRAIVSFYYLNLLCVCWNKTWAAGVNPNCIFDDTATFLYENQNPDQCAWDDTTVDFKSIFP